MRLTFLVLPAFLMFLAVCCPAVALAAPGVFTPLPDAAVRAAADNAVDKAGGIPAVRSRLVTVDAAALFPMADGGRNAVPDNRLGLNLFDDVTVAMTPTTVETLGPAQTTVLVGENDAATGGQSRFAQTSGVLYGVVRTSGRLLYEIAPAGGDAYVIREIDQGSYPDEHEVVVPDAALPRAADAARAGTAADDGSRIDIMVVYTPSTRTAVGGTAAMASRIALGISETNQGYANSGLVQRFRLVYSGEVDYTESSGDSGFDAALNDLQGTADGKMDNVHALRNAYGADIVSLIINNDAYCGLGYLMTSTASDFAAYAFNVVHYSCATGYYSLAHECGHNQGAQHERANASPPILYSYAYGYQQTAASPPFRTIMAYNCDGGCTRVNYWSNPDVSYNGYPTGVVSTSPTAADNRLTLNNTRTIAANWRQAVTRTGVIAPLNGLLLNQ
ncbi:MAG: hypothetical protein B193_1957 [Solidesulfovibrio magneticus str. Maddingley MBC34]|uniref:Peptidyl-Asp metalloendopeptidase n=1 Tax=Solidesulfovibrio magneticus str. Maddingley MBC34 TaxID=1206767 RepID=K6HA13_9BACT|nr:MAG: hypothetical protein B193_1957 [Solidesulfovibrio magneticus str. Maddingley MBC34]